MDDLAIQLDTAVRLVCPAIDGVYIGDPANRVTWGVWFQVAATTEQKAAAQNVIQTIIFS